MHPPVAPQHRYRAENHHRQPRTSKELAGCMGMAPSSDSEPCIAQRPHIADLQPPEEPAPEAGTSSESHDQAATTTAEARPDEPPAAEAENKKKKDDNDRAAEDDAAAGSCFDDVEPARRPEESARERLKRHRAEMAGRVRVPDMWGQERLLKDWVDCAVFDRPLAATAGLLNARDALVAQCAAARRSTGRTLRRVQNGCL